MTTVLDPLSLRRGPTMPNRFMLAPLTNQQSHPDGTLSDEEYRFLTMRASGGFGATMTCGAHVAANGQGFAGQLGIFDDKHLPGLTRLAAGITEHDSLALVQLYHAGNRAAADLIDGPPVSASADDSGTRELTVGEIAGLVEGFAEAAARAEESGFAGVELHGAHGYLISQFMSPELNQRTDEYGGSAENRNRLLLELIEAVDAATGPGFVLGVRTSPERFGIDTAESIDLARQLLVHPLVDFLDVSLWDYEKEPEDERFAGRPLAGYFTELPRDAVALGLAGKIYQPADVAAVIEGGADFVLLGRGAILNHDFPNRMKADPAYEARVAPASAEVLRAEGLSASFLDYMSNWPNFVVEE